MSNSVVDRGALPPLFYQNYKEPLKSVVEVKGEGYGYMGTVATDESGDFLQCHLCGELHQMLNNHIRSVHNLKVGEYKKMFELAPTTALVGEKMRAYYSDYLSKRNMERTEEQKQALIQFWKDVKEGRRAKPANNHRHSLEVQNKKGNCPDQLLDKIRKLAQELGRTPSSNEFNAMSGSHVNTVKRTFGSWEKALNLVGMTQGKPGKTPEHTKASVIQAIKDFRETHGRVPRKSDLNRGYICSHSTIRNLFGGLQNARDAAGVEQLVQVSNNEWVEVKPKTIKIPVMVG